MTLTDVSYDDITGHEKAEVLSTHTEFFFFEQNKIFPFPAFNRRECLARTSHKMAADAS